MNFPSSTSVLKYNSNIMSLKKSGVKGKVMKFDCFLSLYKKQQCLKSFEKNNEILRMWIRLLIFRANNILIAHP